MSYQDFLKSKVVIAESFGIDTSGIVFSDKLFPHQKDIVNFCLEGGRRAIFASFGLGKTFMQLEIAKQIIAITKKPFLICCPLGVSGEFKRDNEKLGTGHTVTYITDTDSIPESLAPQIYLTNYERVRKGDIDATKFGGVSFDEASILRNLKTDTTNMVLKYFRAIQYRFVATATPTPNDYIEILNYADYLGVISRGHALTRFFQRDSTKAGNLKLYPNKAKEFWQWVSTWAAFINTPADLGYDDSGYALPPLNVVEQRISYASDEPQFDDRGNPILLKQKAKGLKESSKETRETVEMRCERALEVAEQQCEGRVIFWCLRNSEQDYIVRQLKAQGKNVASVHGSLKNSEKEDLLIGFSEGKFDYLVTKPKIAGSGCNFQDAAFESIFVSIDDKFNDFIQAMHRTYRFGQKNEVSAHVVYTEYQDRTFANLMRKWDQHNKLQAEMISLVREYGLNSNLVKSQMERQIFAGGAKRTIGSATVYNNDTVVVHQDKGEMPDNSIDLYLTSIPFGDHYEYSDNYNDFGHNHGNEKFFEQMDFLIPEMLRCLKPGRVAAIHVKDRIRYSYQNGTSFTTISDFSGHTVRAFEKHGFYLIGKITVTTDVVAENNQTYRLGWTEQCKDSTKMGVGLPEYVLLFRKAPTHADNSYADEPVTHTKEQYTKARWQLDAHSYQRSSGDRLLTGDELRSMEVKRIVAAWKKHNQQSVYDFNEHLAICEEMDELEKLSSTFMTLPPHSNSDMVWTDVSRMRTLNANQVQKKKEKHICLAPGTLILTKRGYIPITDVVIGDETLTHTGKWKTIIAKQLTRRNADVVQTKAQGVPNLITTPDHKLWTRKHRGYRPSETFMREAPQWVEAKDTKSHYLNQKLPPVMDSELSELDCWIVGRWLADGHIDTRGHQFFISVGNAKIEEFESKCSQYIGHKVDKGSSVQYGLKNLPGSVRDILFKCGKGAANKVLPAELISLDKEKSESLLLGYLSGDGYLDDRGVYHISSVSRALLLGFSIVAQRAWGVISSVYASKKAGTMEIEGRTVSCQQLWVMTIRRNGKHTFGKILEDGAWKKVRDVVDAGSSDVWCIQVEGDASFTAEGCIVKNCPLQFDIIDRLIERYSMPGELVCDPFGGIMSTPYRAMKMGRKSLAIELNSEYFNDGVYYLNAMDYKMNVPTLFDMIDAA